MTAMGICGQTGEVIFYGLQTSSRSEKVTHFVQLVSLARYIGSTSRKMLANIRHLPVVGGMKLVTFGLIPFRIHDIGAALFAKGKLSGNEKIDLGLDLVSTVGSVGDTVVTFSEGLAAVGAVAEHAIRWAKPLVILSAVLEAAGLVLLAKKMIETHRFSRELTKTIGVKKEEEEYTLDDLKKIRQLIAMKGEKEKSFASKHFGVDGQFLITQLDSIKDQVNSEEEEAKVNGNARLQQTMRLLKGRITGIQRTHALNMITGIISLIAFGLLFTPFAPIGYGILVLTTAVSLRGFFVDKFKTHRFELAMKGEQLP